MAHYLGLKEKIKLKKSQFVKPCTQTQQATIKLWSDKIDIEEMMVSRKILLMDQRMFSLMKKRM